MAPTTRHTNVPDTPHTGHSGGEQDNAAAVAPSTREDEREYNEYSKRIGTLIAKERRLLKNKAKLASFREPLMWLQRTNGSWEYYENVKEEEFKIPDLPVGVEKVIQLGKQWQQQLPYAGELLRTYICHEDYRYPIKLEYNYVWVTDPKDATKPRYVKVNLAAANINSEAFRDRERKVLMAWEKFKADSSSANIKAWAKFLLYAAGAVGLIFLAYKFFLQGKPAAASAAANASNATLQAAKNLAPVVITGG